MPFSNVIFTLSIVNGKEHHQVAFNTPYLVGSTYTISYEIEVIPTSPLVIVELDADFTQTAGTASRLIKNSVPLGNPAAGIDQIKTAVRSTGNTLIAYSPGVRSLAISETLTVNGTVSSVTNTVVQSGVVPTLVTTASDRRPDRDRADRPGDAVGRVQPDRIDHLPPVRPERHELHRSAGVHVEAIAVNGNGTYTSTPGFTTTAARVSTAGSRRTAATGNPPRTRR